MSFWENQFVINQEPMGVHRALRKMRIFCEFCSLIGDKEYMKIFMILEIKL